MYREPSLVLSSFCLLNVDGLKWEIVRKTDTVDKEICTTSDNQCLHNMNKWVCQVLVVSLCATVCTMC